MKKPTLEQMKAWRDQATERLSVLARNNAIEEPIESGEECYQLGDDCCKPDGYGQFRWVTEDQFDSVLPPGIEHDRYVAMTNTFDFDGEAKEWADNWNDPEYWDDAADEALGDGQADGAFRAITTGHSNRRRTQKEDFEAIQVWYPADLKKQKEIVRKMESARNMRIKAERQYANLEHQFDDMLDNRDDEYPQDIDNED